MTPWVEAASPLSSLLVAAGSGRAARACAGATCRGQGRSAALSPRPAQVPGRPRGEGLWVTAGVPGLAVRRRPAHARSPPRPAPAHVHPRNGSWRCASAPREVNLCWCGSFFVASPGLGSLAFANLPFAQPLCTRLRRRRRAESWKPVSITGRSPWPRSCAVLGGRGGAGGWFVRLRRKLDGEVKL